MPMTLPEALSARARSSGCPEANSVVSVGPYMLDSRGASSACRAYQSARRPGSHDSPPTVTYRSAQSDRSSPTSWKNEEGVWFSTVTRSAASNAANSRGDRDVRYGTTTSRPPDSSGPHSSHTVRSKA
ncbi:hypothetical protein Airi02_030050 [Actinoallomurus iriomotensis]|uniref:Uncharacterized protein n=1 Tax=Actinoallomurus iriomotensis TaxID=478107 RepID=A0A9W6RYG0_9ACTN|nr:hypothetical protein Airi02_030050 [Actinoallomurus iriomotensis]